jgi:hypothetical protein
MSHSISGFRFHSVWSEFVRRVRHQDINCHDKNVSLCHKENVANNCQKDVTSNEVVTDEALESGISTKVVDSITLDREHLRYPSF